MQVLETDFPGLVVLEPKVFKDERGFFLESYSRSGFLKLGIDAEFVQDNHAYSKDRFVLRGLHFQTPPAAQAKLVWVVRGAVLDIALDLRVGSPTYGKIFQTELSADNFRRLFIPKGFAHGYVTLCDDTEFLYKVDYPYSPTHDSGVNYRSPGLDVDWEALFQGGRPILSEKDRNLISFEDFSSPFEYQE